MEEIRTAGGAEFGNKGTLAIALKQKGLTDTYEAIEKDGGWVGIPKKGQKKEKLTKCSVHRTNCDPDNKDNPISITVNTANNKKVFWPGQEVELTDSQIGVLKNSVEEVKLTIPPESGVYESQNPIALARSYYPTMTPSVDQASGMIDMISRTPNYIIEAV